MSAELKKLRAIYNRRHRASKNESERWRIAKMRAEQPERYKTMKREKRKLYYQRHPEKKTQERARRGKRQRRLWSEIAMAWKLAEVSRGQEG